MNKFKFLEKASQGIYSFVQTIKLIWKIEPKLLTSIFIANILLGLIFAPMSFLSKLVIDRIVNNIGSPNISSALSFIAFLIVLRVSLEITRELLYVYSRSWREKAYKSLDNYMVFTLAYKKTQVEASLNEDPEFKDRFNKLERNVGSRLWPLIYYVIGFPENFSGLITSTIILVSFQPLLVILIFLFLLPQVIIQRKYVKKQLEIQENSSTQWRIYSGYFSSIMQSKSMMEIRILGVVKHFLKKIIDLRTGIMDKETEVYIGRQRDTFLVSLPLNIIYLIFEIYLAAITLLGRITIGSLQFYVSSLSSLRYSFGGTIESFSEFYSNYSYVKELLWLEGIKTEIVSGDQPLPEKIESIEFKDVWFRYKESTPWILTGINLIIGKDEDIAIVGENGAGKSTLIKLLCRFYDPNRGQILINGIDIKQLNREDYWNNLGVLFQAFETFPMKARESIGFGRIEEINNDKKIIQAAKNASIDEFIEGLPLKYDNPLQADLEKGVEPSVGQWQRIGIARIFMRNPKLVILDEPTSNVDSKSEEEIFQRVLEEGKEKNLILISHRFSTVRKANRIAVMDKGKIVEHGSHEELMKKKGLYEELFSLQAKAYQ